MAQTLYPLRLRPVYKNYLWGGDRFARLLGRELAPGIYAESWEVSDRPEGMSVVANGAFAGRTLAELGDVLGEALTPVRTPAGRFPLLIKLIDARQRTSLQVHPNEQGVARAAGAARPARIDRSAAERLASAEAKTECWVALPGSEGGVYAGLRPDVERAAFEAALAAGDAERWLNWQRLTAGDALLIPGGCLHAIDAGCFLLEVQQNSDTTYRVLDWNRRGADGQLRELHLEAAWAVIDWRVPAPHPAEPQLLRDEPGGRLWQLLDEAAFELQVWELFVSEEDTRFPLDDETGGRPAVLYVARGAAVIASGGREERLTTGCSCLLPAALGAYRLAPAAAPARVFVARTGRVARSSRVSNQTHTVWR